VSFTTLRLVSGALVLAPIAHWYGRPGLRTSGRGSWGSGLALFTYAATFSIAYVSLSAGMGALILFGAVQVTMIVVALQSGERLRVAQWVGAGAAVCGLAYLVWPGISAPHPVGALLMFAAGIAWGVYSVRGKGAPAPVIMTAGNFARTVPLTVLASAVAIAFSTLHLEPLGVLLASISGAVTSGLGYVLWYKALGDLTTTQASIVQLVVPVLAAFGGVAFLGEQVSLRLVAASVLILGGVGLAVKRQTR
jgi:drug/metabolite transporter (DMT)-like permease